ncbi:hypothetical protein OS190_08045 [Sulfitobacter sp. F26204]|uniref:hypothetical protein n=1 Tax=Sulfitobacter sp. F26204 TaxID=2996014 RepID=UPI00225DF49F|nr:hypothetical protein [Sulfitobacter sp. F26204]MCX7559520.1 hypothetical protein [Sulfitobacter sp. F26204]
MTNNFRMILCTVTALSLPAYAMGAGNADLDTNEDGLLSVAEVQAVYPDITPAQFSAMDLNADGALDDSEVQAAQEAGMMPAPTKG